MKIQVLKTKKFLPPKDRLEDLIDLISPKLKERMVVVITSKVVSICEGNTLKIEGQEKDSLIIQEAQKYLPRKYVPGGWVMHTMKNNFLIPSSGIDESNGNGFFIFWPKDPSKSAWRIWRLLQNKTQVKNFGVIISDSHSIPLRRGVIGFCLGYFGFEPLKDYRGKEDIFGRILSTSITNIPDSLAAAAVFSMGEGKEQTPVALISGVDSVKFIQKEFKPKKGDFSFEVPPQEDLFVPFLRGVKWKKGKSI